ncbi:MAG: flagellar filament capping protein FliD [Xylophilus ampelinus]
MGISSTGIGSGIDVETVVSKLVALEKAPLTTLAKQAAAITTKVSTFAQVKSLVSTFADAAAKLTRDSGWNSMAVTSSDSTAVNAKVSGIAAAGSYSLTVSKVAQAQSSVTANAVPSGTTFGTGSLSIKVGTADAVTIPIESGSDTSLAGIAAKINDKKAGVVAMVVSDSSGDRLMVRSSATGAANGFTITGTSSDGNTTSGLGGMAFTVTQAAQDTEASLNGMTVSSATRDLSGAVPGLTFTVSKVIATPVDISVAADTATTKKNVQAFVDSYNAINDLLSTSVKYDADTKTAGTLQGDSTAVGLQNILRSMMGSRSVAGAFSTLSDVGISIQRGGNLLLDGTKFDKALADKPDDVKQLFSSTSASSDGDKGIAVKFKALTSSLLAFDGTLNAKSDALAAQTKRNESEQDKVEARAASYEKRLRAQYSALDTQMGSLTALNSYVSQQITNWNKSTS